MHAGIRDKEMVGVYQIRSKVKPDRIYIGSSVDVHSRWRHHINELKRGVHNNKKLQRHFDKYGEGDLEFTIRFGCEKTELLNNEQFLIDAHKPYFNICPKAGNTMGYVISDEARHKMSEKAKGRKHSDETRRKISEHNKGRRRTEEFCIQRRNQRHTEETKDRIRQKKLGNKNALGHVLSEETKRILREQKMGNTHGFQKGHNISRKKKKQAA